MSMSDQNKKLFDRMHHTTIIRNKKDFRNFATTDAIQRNNIFHNWKLHAKQSDPRSFIQQAGDGLVPVLNSTQIRYNAQVTKQFSNSPERKQQMDKIIKKTRTQPFMYRIAPAWDKPAQKSNYSLTNGKKLNGVVYNSPEAIATARGGVAARNYRIKLMDMRKMGKLKAPSGKALHHKMSKQFTNHLNNIQAESDYFGVKDRLNKMNNYSLEHQISTGQAYSKKYHLRNGQGMANQDMNYIQDMETNARQVKRFNDKQMKNQHGFKQSLIKSLSHPISTFKYAYPATTIKLNKMYNHISGKLKPTSDATKQAFSHLGKKITDSIDYAKKYYTHQATHKLGHAGQGLMNKLHIPTPMQNGLKSRIHNFIGSNQQGVNKTALKHQHQRNRSRNIGGFSR